jgi:hypothetical protein
MIMTLGSNRHTNGGNTHSPEETESEKEENDQNRRHSDRISERQRARKGEGERMHPIAS